MKKVEPGQVISILANMGVIAGIVFLALEINQNTDALYAESRQATLTAAQAELLTFVNDPELLLLIIQDEALTARDQVRISAWLASMMRAREYSWLQYRDGIMDEDQWATERAVIQWLLEAPRTRAWWEASGRNYVGINFSEFIDNEVRDWPITVDRWRAEANWAPN